VPSSRVGAPNGSGSGDLHWEKDTKQSAPAHSITTFAVTHENSKHVIAHVTQVTV
jgi:hypothetical protein